jgi:hypothetical protein
VKLSGNQWQDKTYFKHTGYAGSEKFIPVSRFREKDPGEVSFQSCLGEPKLTADHSSSGVWNVTEKLASQDPPSPIARLPGRGA